eukprot:CAMPEP_0202921330 /NCGR_PEP_ID=MMETSP1392-20130828/77338_1 /ASSEMBLY_ACC=CAM_ASM_000868 /TAXON_ID=225041 /ORGANISM="Chlamydomonas chlamydogama, Strain SAG 11-48b" /LENGTH=49 /DNA_ID=CAMNT_0049614895 /DNA_START=285 /DNA_END=434 /DNA_ORIENTATION=-
MSSFAVAIAYFSLEMFVYKTVGLKGAMTPMIIAGTSVVWMALGYSTYTK